MRSTLRVFVKDDELTDVLIIFVSCMYVSIKKREGVNKV